MTKLQAMRGLLSAPRDHADMNRIGHRRRFAEWATSDGREKQSYVFRVLRTVARKQAA